MTVSCVYIKLRQVAICFFQHLVSCNWFDATGALQSLQAKRMLLQRRNVAAADPSSTLSSIR
jgi:hypothetical protein